MKAICEHCFKEYDKRSMRQKFCTITCARKDKAVKKKSLSKGRASKPVEMSKKLRRVLSMETKLISENY